MSTRAKGTFEVKLNPQPPYDDAHGVQLGRITVDKTFAGDLEATSRVEMLTATASAKGSGGYVAMERVTGTLHGRSGSFVFQHSGTRTPGSQQLTITVVPDSGTGSLEGIAGALTIEITAGKHFYTFDYTLGDG